MKIYGGAKLNKDEQEALKIHPKMCVFEPVSQLECEIEAEKMCVKLRSNSNDYQNPYGESIDNENRSINIPHSQNNDNPFADEIDENEDRQEWPIDRINKLIDMSELRPTDKPNKTTTLPPPLKANKEL